MCTTTTHYATHVSVECSLGGSGQCDGTCIEHGAECTCSCHGDPNLPNTTDEVRDWHDEQDSVVASLPVEYPHDGDTTYSARVTASHTAWIKAEAWIAARTPDGKQFKVHAGQDRMVVVEDYS